MLKSLLWNSRVSKSCFVFRVFANRVLFFACSLIVLCFSRVSHNAAPTLVNTRNPKQNIFFQKKCFEIRMFAQFAVALCNSHVLMALHNMRISKQNFLPT